MSKVKSSLNYIRQNITELWLGLLLFVGLPAVVGFYTDWRGALATSLIAQTIVLTLYLYKASK